MNRHYNLKNLMKILGEPVCSNERCLVQNRCRDPECLQISHKNSDGWKDRKRFKTTYYFYKYYIRHPDEARERLEILCANCNWKKRKDPHEAFSWSYTAWIKRQIKIGMIEPERLTVRYKI